MELLPLGLIVIIDTAGLDDVGDLGKLRVEKTTTFVKIRVRERSINTINKLWSCLS